MSDPYVSVRHIMTPSPHAIEVGSSIADAKAMMDEHGVHHLPVMQRGRLVGLVSDRDLRAAWHVGRNAPESTQLPVAVVCSKDDLYVVEPTASVAEVVGTMAERSVGSAIVVEDGSVIGIVTTTDVCRCLASLLRTPP